MMFNLQELMVRGIWKGSMVNKQSLRSFGCRDTLFPMVALGIGGGGGGASIGGANKRRSYERNNLLIRKLLLLASAVLLLMGCGGGGSGGSNSGTNGGGPDNPVIIPADDELFNNASLVIIPSGDSFNITLRNFQALSENMEGINITAIAGADSKSQSISRAALQMQSGKFVLANLTSGQQYYFSVTLIYTNGSLVSIPIAFVRTDNREDHNDGGILLAANRDGDGRADNGTNGGGPDNPVIIPADAELFNNASLVIIPSGDSFNITLRNFQALSENMEGINITAITGTDRKSQSISRATLQMQSGKFVLANLMNGTQYHFSVTLIYTNGSLVSIPIAFVRTDNREDHNGGGILLAANWDGDGRADSDPNENDNDNDGIEDDRDECDFSPRGWRSSTAEDTDRDGCRDRDEDDDLAGIMNLRGMSASQQVMLHWTNPPVAIASLNISWRDTDGNGGWTRIQDNPTTHLIRELSNGRNYTLEVVVHYANGGVSMAHSIRLLVDEDSDKDGVVNSLDNCPMIANSDQLNTDGDGEGDVCDGDRDGDDLMDAADIDDDGDGLIEISTADRLAMMRQDLTGSSLDGNTSGCPAEGCMGYELSNDINLTGNWIPVGNKSNPFRGIFDGNYHTIRDLNIDTDVASVGFFGAIANATVKRVHIEFDEIVTSFGLVGGDRLPGIGDPIMGAVAGNMFNRSRLFYVSASGNKLGIVPPQTSNEQLMVGGLVGLMGFWGSEHQNIPTYRDSSAGNRIIGSFAVIDTINTTFAAGGLVGYGITNTDGSPAEFNFITASYARINQLVTFHTPELRGTHFLSGIAARLTFEPTITSHPAGPDTYTYNVTNSYGVVGGIRRYGLYNTLLDTIAFGNFHSGPVLSSTETMINQTYGVAPTSGIELGPNGSINSLGLKTQEQLQGYMKDSPEVSHWTSEMNLLDRLGIWCDSNNNGRIDATEKIDTNLLWDFGTSTQYPAIRCSGVDLDSQRKL